MQDVQTLLERPKFYHNVDGVGELSVGFMVAGFTAFQWATAHSRQDSIWNKVYTLFVFVGILCAVVHYGSNAIKKRITYRRTGFVSYRKRDLYWPGMIGFGMACAVSGIGLIVIRRDKLDAIPLAILLMGLLMAAAYSYGIARAHRWKWIVAALLVVAAVVVALLPVGITSAPMAQSWIANFYNVRFLGSLFLYLAFYGLILLVSGGISLGLYLHKTRDAGADTE